jgi:hypothetical protein
MKQLAVNKLDALLAEGKITQSQYVEILGLN